MDPQHHRRPRLVTLGAFQHSLDEPFLKFPYSLIEQDSPLHHLYDKPFQLISHVCTLQMLSNF